MPNDLIIVVPQFSPVTSPPTLQLITKYGVKYPLWINSPPTATTSHPLWPWAKGHFVLQRPSIGCFTSVYITFTFPQTCYSVDAAQPPPIVRYSGQTHLSARMHCNLPTVLVQLFRPFVRRSSVLAIFSGCATLRQLRCNHHIRYRAMAIARNYLPV